MALALGAICLTGASSRAATSLASSVFGSGGDALTGASTRIQGTLGQTLVGVSAGASSSLQHGWWSIGGTAVVAVLGGDGAVAGPPRFEFPSPNPSVRNFQLSYYTPRQVRAELQIYDVSGRHIRSLASGTAAVGAHSLSWDGRDDAGKVVGGGIYFARLNLDGVRLADRRMVLLR